MEQNYSKIDINELFEKEINIFNSSLDSLNNYKKMLMQYSSFIQKYLDIINTYYMSLTELNASFPMNLFSSTDDALDEEMKRISQLFLSFIQNQINNILNSLSVAQSILFALNKSISNSDTILDKVKEKNTNIFTNIQNLNDSYHHQYLLMINSFDNLENKIVKRYINNKYNKNEYNGNDENVIKNCVSISKKLENSFLNFKNDEIKQYINEYYNNLEDAINNKILYNTVFRDCIKNIINCFNSYFNNSINSIRKELSDYANDSSNIETNENIINNKIKEKEINSLIYNFFDTKKYKIKILQNKVLKIDSDFTVDVNDDNQIRLKSEISLSEEDIYNIVKEIYDYDFISINKEDYDLEVHKEKLKLHDLTAKLLSYDSKNNVKEKITDDEVQALHDFLKIEDNNYETNIYFISELYQFRVEGKFEMTIRVFDIINNILQNILDNAQNDEDNGNIKLLSSIVMISFTFYIIKINSKYYIKERIKDHKVFKSKEFWNDYTVFQIDEDLEKIEKNINDDEKEKMKDKIHDVLFSKIFAITDIMKEFGMNKDDILTIIENLMIKYKTDKKSQESLLTIINQQM